MPDFPCAWFIPCILGCNSTTYLLLWLLHFDTVSTAVSCPRHCLLFRDLHCALFLQPLISILTPSLGNLYLLLFQPSSGSLCILLADFTSSSGDQYNLTVTLFRDCVLFRGPVSTLFSPRFRGVCIIIISPSSGGLHLYFRPLLGHISTLFWGFPMTLFPLSSRSLH